MVTAMTSYIGRLNTAIQRKRNSVVVGIDPRFADLPQELQTKYQAASPAQTGIAAAFEEFSKRIIDVVAPLVPAVKPQSAFFEECGPAGCVALGRVIRYARDAGLIVICDAKRGDIGSTAEAYARGYLAGSDPDAAPWGADALTINAYLGRDTLQPFIDVAVQRGGGLYVLVRTSNPGAGTFQNRVSDGLPLYRHVAAVVEELAVQTRGADPFGAVGAVVGATYPQEITELRQAMPHTHFLVPGYGSQGGTAQDVAKAFVPGGLGAVVNSSRGIIFAHKRAPYSELFGAAKWESAVAAATQDMINDLAKHVGM
ncbi:MAG: Orotidine 5-phosphate decarboxylase [Planctomycetaceae bacterium]|nr:Orotidine 5-phosphate decarboxylase [Planctomycetaceae bacterium]